MPYQRGFLGLNFDLKRLADFVLGELKSVEKAQYEPQDFIDLATLNAEPSRVFDGLVAKADGTNWDPIGDGTQMVYYDGGAWHSLGGGGGGTGDVVGPASAVNNHVVFFDGTTGKLIKDSGLTLSGTNTGDQDLSAYAPLASPTFTGTPAGPTATGGTNTTQLATTAFVQSAISGLGGGTGDVTGPGSSVNNNIVLFDGTTGKLIKDAGAALSAYATLASPTFSGTPAAPTAAGGTNTTQIATTAFVQAAVSGGGITSAKAIAYAMVFGA